MEDNNKEKEETKPDKGVLFELGKEYFREMLKREVPNIKFGEELKFGITMRGKDGEPIAQFVETINKSDL